MINLPIRRPRLWWSSLPLLALAALPGCGDLNGAPFVRTHPVSGQVLLADGKPLATGRVCLLPQETPGLQAVGDLGPDGRFELQTFKPGDGAVAGKYLVRIDPAPQDSKVKGTRIPQRYTDEATSGLVATIDAGTSQLPPIQLKLK
jgi:hypothetical protein